MVGLLNPIDEEEAKRLVGLLGPAEVPFPYAGNPIGWSTTAPPPAPQEVYATPKPAPPSQRPVNDLMARIDYETGTPRGFLDLPGYFAGGAINGLLAGPAQMENVQTGYQVDPQGLTAGVLSLSAPGWLKRPQPGVLSAVRPPATARGPSSPLPAEIAAAEGTPGARVNLTAPVTVPGYFDQVSTRVPWAVDTPIDPHTTRNLRIGIDAYRDSAAAFPKNAALLRDGGGPLSPYPDLPVGRLRHPESITERAIDHITDNLTWMHNKLVDQFGQPIVNRMGRWYDGANRIAINLANDYGYEPRQTAGAIAAMSPQKDWFQNGDLGRRVIDITNNQAKTPATPDMRAWADRYIANARAKADTETKAAKVDQLEMDAQGVRRGAKLGDLNDVDARAFWVRAFDEAHNPRDYPIITPEGKFGPRATTGTGAPQRVAWGSFNEISKALQALDAFDLPAISRMLGGNHKVRSFYNNIISPNSPDGHVTIDTHAIAGSHLRPLAGEDFPVRQGLGLAGSSSAETGSKGTYGLYHEAYGRAARGLDLLPRQLQSIDWEGVRGLFEAAQKRNATLQNDNRDLWSAFRSGRMSAEEARSILHDQAGGITPPAWINLPE
jgi:hypothetical protein